MDEDQVLYTTVTVEKPIKKRPEKDYIFCVVFICIFSIVLADGIFVYAFRASPINLLQTQYLRETQKSSTFMTTQFNIGKTNLQQLKDVMIPADERMRKFTSCFTLQTGDSKKRADTSTEFAGFANRLNQGYMAIKELT